VLDNPFRHFEGTCCLHLQDDIISVEVAVQVSGKGMCVNYRTPEGCKVVAAVWYISSSLSVALVDQSSCSYFI
jgi:hypothetical protein